MNQTVIKYHGSQAVETSVANQELVPAGYQFTKMSLEVDQDCHVRVNGQSLFIRAGRVFNTEPTDPAITSFVVVDEGITFTWIAV
ncbi:hypothetical protein [Aneurinibacillus migulanus]|uniref:Uncharacterized protein n=1 Tax=Aneurinibacillus migulanus TaxID=47500 RepID=A0A0D1X6D2_ANEMI|nr:hypothetical protein [Aneurinibacillus migulanus]KIV50061.1 hypothetical protein TS65_29830 [Aneurinibacillus migulanus]KON95220.1 hypothetical protein AF333_06750 [Aneurinibacillus migulanus]MED0895716.1 hypothetical protein [Aneurinibacillus migulanus]MED1619286.1 hypothetical protein [Aneurinibacillus migulanus]SDK32560.1 hypothetical protein SAMN04487909_1499 [Aneurinibacillus migulanus]